MYRYLHGRLWRLGIRQSDLGKILGICASSISHRMTGRTPWTIDEMYKILNLLDEPPDKLHVYFPSTGGGAQ